MQGRYDPMRRRYVLDLSHDDLDFIIEELPSNDGTTRYLLALQAESVCEFVPDDDPDDDDRYCLTHQRFCPVRA